MIAKTEIISKQKQNKITKSIYKAICGKNDKKLDGGNYFIKAKKKKRIERFNIRNKYV